MEFEKGKRKQEFQSIKDRTNKIGFTDAKPFDCFASGGVAQLFSWLERRVSNHKEAVLMSALGITSFFPWERYLTSIF